MAQEIADSTLLDTWGSGGNIVEPDISKIIEGWQLGEQPPHEYMNWLQNTFGSKLNHILKNGVASWNNETEYLVGSSVQHNGNAWLCKTTNTNSEPADVNANWKRIITIEALENLLVGYVATTGDQTIAGVKTFSSSPKIPDATQANEAVAKGQLDGVLSSLVAIPTGFIIANPSNTIPTGFLECNGATISRSTYSYLFSKISTLYGAGNESTTFTLPDLRGEFIRGWDNGRGVDAGRTIGSSQSDAYKSHTHTGSTNSTGAHTHTVPKGEGYASGSSNYFGNASASSVGTRDTGSAGEHSHTVTINASGSTETRPRNIAMMYCIKY